MPGSVHACYFVGSIPIAPRTLTPCSSGLVVGNIAVSPACTGGSVLEITHPCSHAEYDRLQIPHPRFDDAATMLRSAVIPCPGVKVATS